MSDVSDKRVIKTTRIRCCNYDDESENIHENENKNENNTKTAVKKCVNITGKHSIDKLTKSRSKREVVKQWNLDEEFYTHTKQVSMMNSLFLSDFCENKELVLRELKNKRNGYKGQDKDKGCLDNLYFISLNRIIELIVESRLKCYYCTEDVFLFYKHIREPKQWTLDRIDNEQGHNAENCVISCLSCNIQRRTMNDEKFKFTKQMKIIKRD